MPKRGGTPAPAKNEPARIAKYFIAVFAILVLLLATIQGVTVHEIGLGPLKVGFDRPEKTTPLTVSNCAIADGSPGTVQAAPAQYGDLQFCPIRVNGGSLPITEKDFGLLGQILGPQDQRRSLALLVLGDPSTCDLLGNRPPKGTFFTAEFHPDSPTGVWSFTDSHGYDEAISIGRTYEYVQATDSALAALRSDRANWNAAHPADADKDKYPGILDMPNGVSVLATFYVAGNPTAKRSKPCGSP